MITPRGKQRCMTGRELSAHHKALMDSGVSTEFRLRVLMRETDLWILDLAEKRRRKQGGVEPTPPAPPE